MPGRVGISVVNSVVSLDFSYANVEHEVLVDRVNEIAPVLESAIDADLARALVSDDMYAKLLPLVLVKDLTYQAYLHKAREEIGGIVQVLIGKLNASQMGYPEFEIGSHLDD